MKFHRTLQIVFVLLLNILAGFFIFEIVKPIGDWYLNKSPALGVDIYNSATYVAYHLKHFSLPFNSFKDIWFGGYPLMQDFPQLTFYLMVPFAKHFGSVFGAQFTAVVFLFILIYCSYLLYFHLSKNIGISLLLAVLVVLSVNIYGSLIWAGSIPYFISQIFFPLGLFFAVRYLERPNGQNLSLLILATGLGILTHPLGVVTFLVPSVILTIFAASLLVKEPKIISVKKFIFYIVGFILTAFTFTYTLVFSILLGRIVPPVITTSKSGVVQQDTSELANAIAQFYKNQINLLYTQTHQWLFILLGVSFMAYLASFLFIRNRSKLIIPLTLLLICLYTIIHPVLNFSGFLNILRHDPYRAFWPFPIALGALVAVFFGSFFTAVFQLFKNANKKYLYVVYFGAVGLVSAAFVVSSLNLFKSASGDLLRRLDETSELSSAFPEALSISTKKEDLDKLKDNLAPSFIDVNSKNKRLYSADATFNIWWNNFFDLPLVRGYTDPPIGTDRRGGLFWLDIAIANDSIVRDFEAPKERALSNSLFLIDWYAVNYFEGGTLNSKGPNPGPSSYLLENSVFDREEEVITYGAALKWATATGRPELHKELPQYLKYYRVADQYSSEIITPTNAPAFLFFGSWGSYEDFLRLLAEFNLNSRVLIPVYGGENIDGMNLGKLNNFDAVILSQYKYKSQKKAYKNLQEYVENGGNLFIDSGGDVKDAESENLPEIFPFETSQRKGLGKSWEITDGGTEVTRDVKFSDFGPLVYNSDEWKLTIPQEAAGLRQGSEVIISHSDKPLLVGRKLGKGNIIWSGINLIYHFNQYKSSEEAKLFKNILSRFVPLNLSEKIPAQAQWNNPQKVIIKTPANVRGVLFKEQSYDGWSAVLKSPSNKKLPIYSAGPTYPGFMYVRVPEEMKEDLTIEFSFTGRKLHWLVFSVNVIMVILLLDIVISKGKISKRVAKIFSKKITKRISFWWDKENE